MRKSPLFGNRIEAWQRGPVILDVYHGFRGQGVHVREPIELAEKNIPEFDEKFFDEIYRLYGKYDAFQLSDMPHEPGGPWEAASKRGHYARMYDDEIREHYECQAPKGCCFVSLVLPDPSTAGGGTDELSRLRSELADGEPQNGLNRNLTRNVRMSDEIK